MRPAIAGAQPAPRLRFCGWVACICLAGTASAFAQAPVAAPVAPGRLADAEFGVATRQFALQRRVEMYQWRRDANGYSAAWSERPIDSAGHDAAHRNPGDFPLQTRYWVATEVSLEGRPVDDEVLKRLGTWHRFRPAFSALPGNLSATFQPEGDGLSSSENPLQPRIGDLRVTWHELRLPELAGKVALRNGTWVLDEAAIAAAAEAEEGGAAMKGIREAAERSDRARWSSTTVAAAVLATTLLALLVALLATRRRMQRRAQR